jgi:hypothetical protein
MCENKDMKEHLILSLTKAQLRTVLYKLIPTRDWDKKTLEECRNAAREFSYGKIVKCLKK